MGDRGHNRHGPKRGGCCAPFAGAGTLSSTMWPGPRSTEVDLVEFVKRRLHPSSHMTTIDMGQKLGGWMCSFFLGVAGSTSNTRQLTVCAVITGVKYNSLPLSLKRYAGDCNKWETNFDTPTSANRDWLNVDHVQRRRFAAICEKYFAR